MLFTKSISDQFWRSYRKKMIFFFIFHFLKFLPIWVLKKDRKWGLSRPLVWKLKLVLSPTANYSMSRAYSLVDFHDYCTTSAHKRSFGHTWSADRLFWFWKLDWVSNCIEIWWHKNSILKLPVYNFNSLSTRKIAWLEKIPLKK